MTDLTIRPFEVHVPDEDLADLQRRIAATRWPPKELVADRSQGVQLATIHDLMTYWSTGGCSTTTPTATTRSPCAFLGGQPAGNLTRDHILDNVTLYWLTGTGASAARSYLGGRAAAPHAAGRLLRGPLPVRLTTFPGGIFRAPRSWVEKLYPHVIYFNQAARGGHFAAWEEPQLFSAEIRRRLDRCASRRHRRGPGGGYLRPASANTRQVL